MGNNNRHNYIDFFQHNRTAEQTDTLYSQRIKDAQEVHKKFSSSFQERSCPICGGENFDQQEDFINLYSVVKCRTCNSEYVNPVPGVEALDYYYNHCISNDQFEELSQSRKESSSIILSERLSEVLILINSLLSNKDTINIVEIGCSSGSFLNDLHVYLKNNDLDKRVHLCGVDIDESAISNPVTDGVDLYASSAQDFAKNFPNNFDLILNFELIEHLHDPFEFMISMKNILAKDGMFHFSTPNAKGFDNIGLGYNDFRPLAHGIFPPMHLQAFTTENIVHFAIRCGFDVIKIDTPGNFDVDIVKRFISRSKNSQSNFNDISLFDDDQLAIIQSWLRDLNSSSHLVVTLTQS